VSYPHVSVVGLVAAHFVPLRLTLGRPADQPLFREHRVLWTPTLAVLDRRGAAHYQSPGFLPPEELADVLRIGLARALMAWSRYDEAARHLGDVAARAESGLAPEALYWLGATIYLKTRSTPEMMRVWNRLRGDYPRSVWAARVPPNQEDLLEQH